MKGPKDFLEELLAGLHQRNDGKLQGTVAAHTELEAIATTLQQISEVPPSEGSFKMQLESKTSNDDEEFTFKLMQAVSACINIMGGKAYIVDKNILQIDRLPHWERVESEPKPKKKVGTGKDIEYTLEETEDDNLCNGRYLSPLNDTVEPMVVLEHGAERCCVWTYSLGHHHRDIDDMRVLYNLTKRAVKDPDVLDSMIRDMRRN